jgi:hypothetical protein
MIMGTQQHRNTVCWQITKQAWALVTVWTEKMYNTSQVHFVSVFREWQYLLGGAIG